MMKQPFHFIGWNLGHSVSVPQIKWGSFAQSHKLSNSSSNNNNNNNSNNSRKNVKKKNKEKNKEKEKDPPAQQLQHQHQHQHHQVVTMPTRHTPTTKKYLVRKEIANYNSNGDANQQIVKRQWLQEQKRKKKRCKLKSLSVPKNLPPCPSTINSTTTKPVAITTKQSKVRSRMKKNIIIKSKVKSSHSRSFLQKLKRVLSSRSVNIAKRPFTVKCRTHKKKKDPKKCKDLFMKHGRVIFAGKWKRLPLHRAHTGTSRSSTYHTNVQDFERHHKPLETEVTQNIKRTCKILSNVGKNI